MPSFLSAPEPSRVVRFPCEDGHVAANLYLPKESHGKDAKVAVVVGGSLTSIKEQMGGTYASELAKRGFPALSLDYRNYGESSGKVRQLENPESKTHDIQSAMDWALEQRGFPVEHVALVGVCTSGGTVLYAAARDHRVAAVGCVASHLAEPAITPSLYDGAGGVERRRAAASAARAHYARTGVNRMIPAYSNTDQNASHLGPMEYYMDPARGGGVPQWMNALAVMSWDAWLDFDPVRYAQRVTAPTLMVHSDGCAMPKQARKVHGNLAGPKALHWTTGGHFEFYDGREKVNESVDAIVDFFRANVL